MEPKITVYFMGLAEDGGALIEVRIKRSNGQSIYRKKLTAEYDSSLEITEEELNDDLKN